MIRAGVQELRGPPLDLARFCAIGFGQRLAKRRPMPILPLEGTSILVPVDFDEPSRRAVDYGAHLAAQLRCRLVLFHVAPPEYDWQRAEQMLEEYFTTSLMAGAEVRRELRSGHVTETILDAIKESGTALVVIGTHGRTGAARAVLGSVAENVVRRSPVPVLVVRGAHANLDVAPYTTAATVSGAIAGAVTGALAGPVGAVAGGAIGAAVGAIAGSTMTRQAAREGAHDHELDDAIGVTDGSLGTPPSTKHPSPEVLAEAAEERSTDRRG